MLLQEADPWGNLLTSARGTLLAFSLSLSPCFSPCPYLLVFLLVLISLSFSLSLAMIWFNSEYADARALMNLHLDDSQTFISSINLRYSMIIWYSLPTNAALKVNLHLCHRSCSPVFWAPCCPRTKRFHQSWISRNNNSSSFGVLQWPP